MMTDLQRTNFENNSQVEANLINSFNNNLTKTIRFDRNIAKNGISFAKFGEDGSLMFDLVVYFANTYQDNFFGFGTLNVDDFCDKMNYKKSNLFKSHSNPLEFKEPGRKKSFEKAMKNLNNNSKANGKDSNSKDDFFYTVLDNALYKLANENLPFRFRVKSNDVNSTGATSVRIIKTIIKQYKNSPSKTKTDLKKIVYQYSLDGEFKDNLTRWFLNINLFSVYKLRKTNSVYLYSYLKNLQIDLIAMNKTFTDSLDFDLLIELAQISIVSPRRAKQQLIIKIENIFEMTDLKGTLHFIKRKENGKEVGYAFQPVITFINSVSKLNSKDYIINVFNAVTTKFLHDSRTKYKELEIYKTNKITFSDWFISSINCPVGDPSYSDMRALAKRCYEFVTKENMSFSDGRITNLMKRSCEIILDLKENSKKSNP